MDYSFTGPGVQPQVAPSEARHIEDTRPERRHGIPVAAIAVMQSILFLGHWLLFATFTSFWALDPSVQRGLGIAMVLLSVSFTIASVLGTRFANPLVSFFYRVAAVWLGILNFLFWAACLCWAADLFFYLTMPHSLVAVRPWIAAVLLGLAVVVSISGIINARLIRRRSLTISLPNLPARWEGRKALMLSDLHLGHVNSRGFARRIASLIRSLQPDIVFMPGDLFDGSHIDAYRAAQPLFHMDVPLGVYFCEGNHEGFGDAPAYDNAVRRGGFHVLRGEAVNVDGVTIAGIPYEDTAVPLHVHAFLESLALSSDRPSILLNHVPNLLGIAEKSGVSLQLSGHTHGGQIFPFTWFTRRVFRQFTHGLNRFGQMQVLTSSGAGTWGPPMRVGSSPEVILITFTSQSSDPRPQHL